MKAAIVPSVNDVWVLKDVATPDPGPNQVLLKVHASDICYTAASVPGERAVPHCLR